MAHTDTSVNKLIINRGTKTKILEILSSIGENEFIMTEDFNIPFPTSNDIGKAIKVNSSGTGFEYGTLITSFNDLLNRPSYNGTPMTGSTNIPKVPIIDTIILYDDDDHVPSSKLTIQAMLMAQIWNGSLLLDINEPALSETTEDISVYDIDGSFIGLRGSTEVISHISGKTSKNSSFNSNNTSITLNSSEYVVAHIDDTSLVVITNEYLIAMEGTQLTVFNSSSQNTLYKTRVIRNSAFYITTADSSLPIASADTLGGVKVGTNLSINENGVLSATDTTYNEATTSAAGLMSVNDKTKLDGIETGAQKNAANTVIDASYVHTDNNYTTDDKNKLAGIDMSTKQDTINDLTTIRNGAALGATAVQPESGKGLFSGNYNDLANKPTTITEISTQYVRVTDLSTGIYKLTYSGQKYVYYKGTTDTSSVYIGNGYTGENVIIYVNKIQGTSYDQWNVFIPTLYMAGRIGMQCITTIIYYSTRPTISSQNGMSYTYDPSSWLTSVPTNYKPVYNSSYASYSNPVYSTSYTYGTSSYSLNTTYFANVGMYNFTIGTSSSSTYGCPYTPTETRRAYIVTIGDNNYGANYRAIQDFYCPQDNKHYQRIITKTSSTYTYGTWTDMNASSGSKLYLHTITTTHTEFTTIKIISNCPTSYTAIDLQTIFSTMNYIQMYAIGSHGNAYVFSVDSAGICRYIQGGSSGSFSGFYSYFSSDTVTQI